MCTSDKNILCVGIEGFGGVKSKETRHLTEKGKKTYTCISKLSLCVNIGLFHFSQVPSFLVFLHHHCLLFLYTPNVLIENVFITFHWQAIIAGCTCNWLFLAKYQIRNYSL